MSEDLKRDVSRGLKAKRILENKLVKEAFAAIEKTIDEGWKNSQAGDEAGRYNAYLMHRIYRQFKDEFERIVRDGDHAKTAMERIKDKIRRVI